MNITTNNVPRHTLDWFDLTANEKDEFSHSDRESSTYFRYKGWTYLLDDFMRCPDTLQGWDGYHGDSFFSGIVVKYVDDRLIVGTYVC